MVDTRNVALSKSILDMKFMKKSKERVEKEIDDAEGKAMYSSQITEEMKKGGSIVFVDTSLSHCKKYIDGRLSFGGMNPSIELLMNNDYSKQLDEVEKRKEKDIQDTEMAQGYSLAKTIGNKFNKNKKNKFNRKFAKPPTEDQF